MNGFNSSNTAINDISPRSYLMNRSQAELKSSYCGDQALSQILMINDIIYNERAHLVAIFKDYLIYDDTSEYLKRYYNNKESLERIPKITEFYESYSKIFPNYNNIYESKYLYKNIKRKQKVINNNQENENKSFESNLEDLKVLNTETVNSILNFSKSNAEDSKLTFAEESNLSFEGLIDFLGKAEGFAKDGKGVIKKEISKNNYNFHLNLNTLQENLKNNQRNPDKGKKFIHANSNQSNKNLRIKPPVTQNIKSGIFNKNELPLKSKESTKPQSFKKEFSSPYFKKKKSSSKDFNALNQNNLTTREKFTIDNSELIKSTNFSRKTPTLQTQASVSIPKFPVNIFNNINIVNNIKNIVYKSQPENNKEKSSPYKSRVQNSTKNSNKQASTIEAQKSKKGIHSRAVSDLASHMGVTASTARFDTNCTFVKSSTLASKLKEKKKSTIESETARVKTGSKKILNNILKSDQPKTQRKLSASKLANSSEYKYLKRMITSVTSSVNFDKKTNLNSPEKPLKHKQTKESVRKRILSGDMTTQVEKFKDETNMTKYDHSKIYQKQKFIKPSKSPLGMTSNQSQILMNRQQNASNNKLQSSLSISKKNTVSTSSIKTPELGSKVKRDLPELKICSFFETKNEENKKPLTDRIQTQTSSFKTQY